jgi:hypothetical protein
VAGYQGIDRRFVQLIELAGDSLPFLAIVKTEIAACLGPREALPVLSSPADECRYWHRLAILESDEREMANIGEPSLARDNILGRNLNVDVNGRVMDVGDASLEQQQFSDMYRLKEVNPIDGCSGGSRS